MIITTGERQLLMVYYSVSVCDTSDVLREALVEINEPDAIADAISLLQKLEGMVDSDFDSFDPELGVFL